MAPTPECGRWRKSMADAKKCANPACTCVPEKGEKYCSAHCEGLHKQVEIVCKCGHEHCGGNA